MQRRQTRWLFGLLAALAGAAVHAQGSETENRAPRAAPAPKPTPAYASPFHGYRTYTPDEALQDWRRMNEEVARLGGHTGQLGGEGGKKASTPPASHQGGHR